MPDSILPPELLDIVFGNLQPVDSLGSTNAYETDSWPKAQEIRESLSACTLVSRSWYPLAHEHLFRDVVYSFQRPPDEGHVAWLDSAIDVDHRWEAYAGDNDPNMPRMEHLPLKTLQMFVDFLQRSPVTRAAIRKLTLSCYPSVDPGDKTDWPSSIWRWSAAKRDVVDPSLLAPLISSLPRLESVRLYDITISKPRDPESTLPHISVPEVQIVSRCFLLPAHVICNLTTHLGGVGKYTVTSPSWQPVGRMADKDTLPNNFPRHIALNTPSIDISHVYDSQALLAMSKTLQRSPFVHNLRRLSITAASLAAAPGVDAVLRCCGPYLQYFKLVVNWIGDEGYDGQILDLTALSELQELVIGFEAMVEWRDHARPWMQYYLEYFNTTIITPKKNLNLQKITLCLSCEDRWIPPIDPGRTLKHRWEDSFFQSHISNFETRFANILHAFGFEGMHVVCNTMQTMWRKPGSQARLRHALPLIFPMLAREKLLIFDTDISTVYE